MQSTNKMKQSQRNKTIDFLISHALITKNIGINEVQSINEILLSLSDVELLNELNDLINANGYNKNVNFQSKYVSY